MAEFDQVEQMTKVAAEATAAEDYTTAERTLRRLLRLQEADLGLSHPDVANTHNDLGVVCDRLGRPEEAEFLYRRALGIARRTLPPDHTSVAASLENLSKLYRAQGKTEKLAKLLVVALLFLIHQVPKRVRQLRMISKHLRRPRTHKMWSSLRNPVILSQTTAARRKSLYCVNGSPDGSVAPFCWRLVLHYLLCGYLLVEIQ